jgi:hypothetical protein
MITIEEAREAKVALGHKLNRPPWLRGIGIKHDKTGSPVIKVNVGKLTEEVRAQIPIKMGNVPVEVDEVGDIVPLV